VPEALQHVQPVTGVPSTLPATQPVPVYQAEVDRRHGGRVTPGGHPMSTLEIRGLRASVAGNEILAAST
jgi:hypothetical protein